MIPMFSPGETVTQVFVIPFVISDVDHVVVSYKQNEVIVLEKTITGGFMEHDESSTSFAVELTQTDSLMFADCDYYNIQVNVYTVGGSRHASKAIRDKNGLQYHREVMGIDG